MKLTLVHNAIGGSSGMGRVAAWMARTALDNDVDLTLVASDVDPYLQSGAKLVRVPSLDQLPTGAWKVAWGKLAGRAVRHGGSGVVHVHQPMLLHEADLMTCHHLARSAQAHGQREVGAGVDHALRELQAFGVRRLDDRLYRRRPIDTHLHFGSELLRSEFCRLYGAPAFSTVLQPPASRYRPVSLLECLSARECLGLNGTKKIVTGYLGGYDLRKGLAAVEALRSVADLDLVVGGPNSDRLDWPETTVVGYVDPDSFLAACDVLVAPSLFDSGPLIVLEALARGIPVVVSDAVGLAADVKRLGAGVVWKPGDDLAGAVRAAARVPPEACASMVEELSEARQSEKLLRLWAECEEEAITRR